MTFTVQNRLSGTAISNEKYLLLGAGQQELQHVFLKDQHAQNGRVMILLRMAYQSTILICLRISSKTGMYFSNHYAGVVMKLKYILFIFSMQDPNFCTPLCWLPYFTAKLPYPLEISQTQKKCGMDITNVRW